jgi:lipoprotein-anchoring transpeptidase ErfK/SrfK
MFRPLIILVVFLCLSSPAFAARIAVTIDLSQQTMTVRVGGDTLYNWAVSTGRKGYRTPTGTYHPTRMHREYYSRKYDNAPMPYSIFFRGGYAIHGTQYVSKLGSVASHGCVRLLTANARTLYNLVREHGTGNTTIKIVQ